ncbi:hypothetical protein BT63DRAFT_457555 [Microthyrium microscopicum]|uniref:RRM domain-containing protein n=1 Tax=Microthyrium microscopicum TaxID=703497 RepID=A0A6A6U6M9_9PEZI|nr:hypothetical protein BT63DRAFT_457555 [Microthyrium microscopicum]
MSALHKDFCVDHDEAKRHKKVIYVTNVDPASTQEDLETEFLNRQLHPTCFYWAPKKHPYQYCHVEFDNPNTAETAMITINGVIFRERPLCTGPTYPNVRKADRDEQIRRANKSYRNAVAAASGPAQTKPGKRDLAAFVSESEDDHCQPSSTKKRSRKGANFSSIPVHLPVQHHTASRHTAMPRVRYYQFQHFLQWSQILIYSHRIYCLPSYFLSENRFYFPWKSLISLNFNAVDEKERRYS